MKEKQTKKGFLKELAEELSYELPERLVRSNVDYYSFYIDDEVKKGRSEEDILRELGDARLIARTIIDAVKSGDDGIPNTADDRDFTEQIYGEEGKKDFFKNRSRDRDAYPDLDGRRPEAHREKHRPHIRVYNFGCLGSLVFLLVIMMIFSFVGTAVRIFMPFLGPILLILIIFWFFNDPRGDD